VFQIEFPTTPNFSGFLFPFYLFLLSQKPESMFVKSEKRNFSGARLSATATCLCLPPSLCARHPVPTCIERCCYPLPCLLALALSHASVAALCCLALLLAEQLHATTATARLAAAVTQAAPSHRGCCCRRAQAAAVGSRRRRRGPELPHGAATERHNHHAVTAETWFPTSVGSDVVAST
jgi:hypothetical protein